MVRRTQRLAHPQSRNGRSYSCHSELATTVTRQETVDSIRQHNGGLVYPETGFNKNAASVRPNVSSVQSGRQSRHNDTSQSYPRVPEYSGRCSVETRQSSAHGMDASQGSIQTPLPGIGASKHRPVCHQEEPPAASIRVTCPRPAGVGSRCSKYVVGRPSRVCVSPSDTPSQGSCQNQRNRVSADDFGRALVASERVVSRSKKSRPKSTSSVTSVGKSSNSPTEQTVSSDTRSVQSARLAHLQKALKAKGYSLSAAKAIARAHRPSTRGLYDDKWGSFSQYCVKRKQDPMQATPQFLADYLLHLRTKKHLKGGTIATYLAAINSVLAIPKDRKVSKIPELQSMLKAFRIEDQKAKFRPPAWELNVVLSRLRGAPYEPLNSSSVAHLTRKTVFLIALATAARVGEIHAIDVTRIKFQRREHGAVFLGLCWDFIAKNQLPGQSDRQFKIPPLSSIVGREDEEELLLCPVRALKIYLERTKEDRGKRKRLFLPVSKTVKTEISKNAIALWLRATILEAYEAAGLEPPSAHNPHEIRALASTMALHSNCSVSAIMEGCFWRSDTVFANHYLRDLAVEDVKGFHSFGPMVVAQQLTKPRKH